MVVAAPIYDLEEHERSKRLTQYAYNSVAWKESLLDRQYARINLSNKSL
jgi:hypothetical protein